MKRFLFFSVVVILFFTITSCISNKKFVYLQDKGNVKMDSTGSMPVVDFVYKLQRGDILYVSLTIDNPEMNKVFVPGMANGPSPAQSAFISGTAMYYVGFTIDVDGNIEFPQLGKINVLGMDLIKAKEAIDMKIRKYFTNFYLQVKLTEFKFTILGYVNRPGQYFYQQNKVSIIEAISQAGDLNNIAKRYEIQLYRQYPDGIRIHKIDLTDRSIINSPYWYIQPNDIVYIVPSSFRGIGDLSSLQTSFGVIAPLLSTLLLVINTYILIDKL
jgi:polysaccharide export outer membrane protein